MTQTISYPLVVVDQMGREISMPCPPRRIISLVPSLTELLFSLGLENEIVGVTKFCVHPAAKTQSLPKIGGTKNFHFEVIDSLQPDLIVANKEENYKEGVTELAGKYPVWVSDMADLSQVYEMISSLGLITNRKVKAVQLIKDIQRSFNTLQIDSKKTALYLIWKNPYMSVGGDTFIHQMMELAGFDNLLKTSGRYPVITEEEIISLKPEFLLLSSEPYPFKEKHVAELKNRLPDTKIILVDGELFSWYGSRLLYSAEYFKNLHDFEKR